MRSDGDLLRVVSEHYPGLTVASVSRLSGQFNDVLIVNDDVVFRFPRTEDAAATLATEIAVLRRLHGRLPIPIPEPSMTAFVVGDERPLFMGYQLLPGRPLDRETLDDLWSTDRPAYLRIARQAGEFLRALHEVPAREFEDELPTRDDAADWLRLLDAFRDELFIYMRPDARSAVEQDFATFTGNPRSLDWQPVPRHGDFGGTNLLYDSSTRRLSGVIDFGGVAIGDPAIDLAAIEAFDPRLTAGMFVVYPELFGAKARRRSAFYRSTFALQQALWAVRVGDADEFADGIADYI